MSSCIQLWRKTSPHMTDEECAGEFIKIMRPFGFHITQHKSNITQIYLSRSKDELWISPIFYVDLEDDYPIATVNGENYYRAVYIECIGSFDRSDFDSGEDVPEDVNLIKADIIMKAVTAFMGKYTDSLFYVTDGTPFYDKQDIDRAASQPLKEEWFFGLESHLNTEYLGSENGWDNYRAEGLE